MTSNKVATNEKPQAVGAEFVIGGLAGIGTGILTNPSDVLKTRLQLQGELSAPGTYRKLYRSTFHAAYQIARHEGILVLQAGLVPVLGLQVIINSSRLGSYYFAKRHGLTINEAGDTNILKTALVAGFAGSFAVIVGSPLYLAKVKLQAHAAQKGLHNGQHLNAWIIMKSLWQEGGFKNLYRGWNANVPRLFIGSAVQMTVFGLVNDCLQPLDAFSRRPMCKTFIASVVSGTFLVFAVHPFDVMATRIYNQGTNSHGKGALYSGMYDTLSKIVRTEGVLGLYKGVFPNWLRLAPYVIIIQTLYERIALIYTDLTK